jgi:hypothetical protein
MGDESGTCSSGTYRIGDAVEELRQLDAESAAVVCLDDAWARPHRNGAFGVEYPTHGFDGTVDVLCEARRVLKPGGWLIADADAWLQQKLLEYLPEAWGNAAEDYGEGYRKPGYVTLVSSDGTPDEGTPGQKLSTGGYPVVFAHKGETKRRTTVSAAQITDRPRENFGWGSIKPVKPYQNWIEGLTDPSERVVVPCAGTAPAAIAAERLGRPWVAIDCEPDAREAFRRRRQHELADDDQQTLPVRADGSGKYSTGTDGGQSDD